MDIKACNTIFSPYCVVVLFLELLLTAGSGLAQHYELGVGGGASIYNEPTAQSPSGEVKRGFNNSFAGSVWIDHELYRYISGEVRYTYENNNPELSVGGTKVAMGGESHTIHYEVQIHFSDKDSSARPFVVIGGGGKRYVGKGPEQAIQPLGDIAMLTRTSEWKGVLTFGGGVKVHVGSKGMFRAEIRDYWSPLPAALIAPAPGVSLGGWIHNIVPLVGIGFRF